MAKFFFRTALVSPVILGAAVLGASSAIAAEMPAVEAATSVDSLTQVSQYSREGQAAVGQVTSVSQLSDVKPTDWAFQALQSLVERYGCIAGYPDKTYRGNRALTRYEFAAGLNACLDRVNELIAASTANMVKKEDLAVLQKLQEQFASELATLRGRVDALDAKVKTLEKQQFSTTTKLAGEAIFAVTDEFTTKQKGGSRTNGNNVVFQDRVRLSLNTSFTGKDLLVTRLAAGNADTFQRNGRVGRDAFLNEGLQTFNFGSTGGNKVVADWVAYYGNLNEKTKFYIPAYQGLHYDYAPTISPALDSGDGGTTTLSVFGQRNPIYSIGGGAGLGLNFDAGIVQATAGYLASSGNGSNVAGASSPTNKNGLFNGDYSALFQLAFTPPASPFQAAVTYVHAYNRTGGIFGGGGGRGTSVGTQFANSQQSLIGTDLPGSVDALGGSAAFTLSPQLVVNGFATYARADFKNDGQGKQNIWTYGLGVALPDFGSKGNLLGLVVGAEPYRAGGRNILNNRISSTIPWHLEGFYKYQLNDKVSVTPGIIWVKNPGQDKNQKDAVIGTVRTTFTF
jgi:hypothetical protein